MNEFNNRVYYLLTISRKKLISEFVPVSIAVVGCQLYTIIAVIIGIGNWTNFLVATVSGAGVGFIFFVFDKGRLIDSDSLEEQVNSEIVGNIFSTEKCNSNELVEGRSSEFVKTDNLLELEQMPEDKKSNFDIFNDDLDEALGHNDTEKSLELLVNRYSYMTEEVLE